MLRTLRSSRLTSVASANRERAITATLRPAAFALTLPSPLRLVACAQCGARGLCSSSARASGAVEWAATAGIVAASAHPSPAAFGDAGIVEWPPSSDTIYQLSSGLGGGGGGGGTDSSPAHAGRGGPTAVGVAIIRISGPLALPLLLTLTRRNKPPEPRKATRVNLYQPMPDEPNALRHFDAWRGVPSASANTTATASSSVAAGAAPFLPSPLLLDTGILCLYFPAPNSFTGEDVVELHVHGTPLLVHNTFDAIERINRRLVAQIVDPTGESSSDGAAEAASSPSSSAAMGEGTEPGALARASSLLSYPPLLRLASPGEFTRRAFLHGKLDLTQVEALGDLLSAQTERQRDQALLQMRGALGALYTQWRLDLLNALAYVEAILDFSEDEQDVGETEVLANVLPKVQAVAASFRAHLADARRGEIVRAGVGIVIAGAPNAGKSTLLNALSRRNVAIVSPVPGTTRDVVENQLNIAGWPCVIADTAGIRKIQATESAAGNAGTEDAALQPQDLAAELSGHDLIEAEGMRRTHERLAASDIKLVLLDASLTVTAAPASTPYDPQVLGMLDERSVLVWTKVDLLPPMQNEATDDASAELAEEIVAPSAAATGRAKLRASQQFYQRTRDAFSPAQLAHFEQLLRSSAAWSLAQQRGARMAFLACSPSASAGSSTNGGGNVGQQRGVQQLLSVLERQIERTVGLDGAAAAAAASSSRVGGPPTAPCSAPSSVPLITRARHRAHVSACLGLLELFESYLERGDLVLAAEQLRLATREIGKITGRVDVEELLDVIFADFCIGK